MHADVSRFLRDTMPLIPRNYNFTIELINNGTNPQDSPFNAGLEASLDVQYAMGLGYPAQVIYYSTGGRGTELDPMTGTPFPPELSDNEPYLEFLEALLAKPDEELPHVLSISYADDEPGVPRAYAERVCDMFAALTARGVTVLAATGDAGAAGQGQTRCWSHELNAKRFISTFPASCPYVTAVGATDNIGPPVTGAVYSAGGFSDFFARPEWQEEVVKPYVDRLLQNYTIDRAWAHRMNMFNHNGRATPDISAIGSAFQIALAGDYAQVLGTSASTPVVAAMVALVNDARMRAGKPSLGWLNPILYQERVRRVLRDVTEGISAGCWFPDGKLEMVGWQAGPGYDTVTGLGTVNDFWQFLEVLMEY
jgi:tripeptidyl-peptidase-1